MGAYINLVHEYIAIGAQFLLLTLIRFTFSPVGIVVLLSPLFINSLIKHLAHDAKKMGNTSISELQEGQENYGLIELIVHYYSLLISLWVLSMTLVHFVFVRVGHNEYWGMITLKGSEGNLAAIVLALVCIISIIAFIACIASPPFGRIRYLSLYVGEERNAGYAERIKRNHLTWSRGCVAAAGLLYAMLQPFVRVPGL